MLVLTFVSVVWSLSSAHDEEYDLRQKSEFELKELVDVGVMVEGETTEGHCEDLLLNAQVGSTIKQSTKRDAEIMFDYLC